MAHIYYKYMDNLAVQACPLSKLLESNLKDVAISTYFRGGVGVKLLCKKK